MTLLDDAFSESAAQAGAIRTQAASSLSGAGELERDPGMPSSTWRLRSDAWEYLRFGVKRIALGSDDESALTRDGEIARNLRALETIEMYWAGFGQRYVRGIAELLRAGDYQAALDRIGRVVQRLRGSTVPDDPRDDTLDEAERIEQHDDSDPRPRFEVLVIDETTAGDRDSMRAENLRLRAPADQFIYDFVVVPSADDAIAALLTNPNILACIIRPGFSGRSTQALSRDLRDTIALVWESADVPTAPASSALSSVQRVVRLADVLHSIRPEIDLY